MAAARVGPVAGTERLWRNLPPGHCWTAETCISKLDPSTLPIDPGARVRPGRVVGVVLPYQRAVIGELFGCHDECMHTLLPRHAAVVELFGEKADLEKGDLGTTHSKCMRYCVYSVYEVVNVVVIPLRKGSGVCRGQRDLQ